MSSLSEESSEPDWRPGKRPLEEGAWLDLSQRGSRDRVWRRAHLRHGDPRRLSAPVRHRAGARIGRPSSPSSAGCTRQDRCAGRVPGVAAAPPELAASGSSSQPAADLTRSAARAAYDTPLLFPIVWATSWLLLYLPVTASLQMRGRISAVPSPPPLPHTVLSYLACLPERGGGEAPPRRAGETTPSEVPRARDPDLVDPLRARGCSSRSLGAPGGAGATCA
jgi:hypothetical protein